MHDLLLISIKGLKDVLEIFKGQSDEIRNVPPAVFFEKAVLKIFRKFLEKHSWQSSYSTYLPPTYLQIFRLANMLNTVLPKLGAGPQISASL